MISKDLTIEPIPQTERPHNPNPCKGRVYRAHHNCFKNSRGDIVYKDTFSLMKRMSCSGCGQCGWVDDTLCEWLDEEGPVIEGHITDGALYALTITDIQTDWETGMVDDYTLGFTKLPKPE